MSDTHELRKLSTELKEKLRSQSTHEHINLSWTKRGQVAAVCALIDEHYPPIVTRTVYRVDFESLVGVHWYPYVNQYATHAAACTDRDNKRDSATHRNVSEVYEYQQVVTP